MERIKQLKSCYGCGLCAAVCPCNVISLKLSSEGFYVPVIAVEEHCTHCGLCEKVCSYLNHGLARNPVAIRSYVVNSNDEQVCRSCSSGGVGFEIARNAIKNGYQACGVRYSITKVIAEHFLAETTDQFEASKGSKYLQSYTVDAFRNIDLNRKWVVFGTPCQIDSFARWIRVKRKESHFVLVDFFCHGVPSYFLWRSYLDRLRKMYGINEISEVIFRDKSNGHGRHSWAINIKSNQGRLVSSMLKDKDVFYRLFLGNGCLNAACYDKCKFKGTDSAADIRIGDLWSEKYSESHTGLSAVLANTDQGAEIVRQLSHSCTVQEESVDIVCDGQMKNRLKRPFWQKKVIRDLSKGKSLVTIYFYMAVSRKVGRLIDRFVKCLNFRKCM